MPPKKKPDAGPAVDADGLRTHCPDGHRLLWPERVRQASRNPTSTWHADASPLERGHDGAMCSGGHTWEQHRARMLNESAVRQWRHWGRSTGKPEVLPRYATPSMAMKEYDRVQTGHVSLNLEISPDGKRSANVIVYCTGYTDPSLRPDDDGDDDEPPAVDPSTRHQSYQPSSEEQRAVQTEEGFRAMISRLRDRGWTFGYNSGQCPACRLHLAARDRRRAEMLAAAQALEAADRDAAVTPAVAATE